MSTTPILDKAVVRVDTTDNVGIYENAPLNERLKLDPNLMVVTLNDIKNIKESNTYNLPRNIDCGSILVRHPYTPKKYVLIQELEDILFKELKRCVFDIAQLLGATKIEWYKEVVEDGIRDFDATGKLVYRSVNVNGEYHNNTTGQNKQTESSIETWNNATECTQQDLEADYQEALNIASGYNLQDNDDIERLLSGRKPSRHNLSTYREVNITITNDLNQTYDYAFSLEAMSNNLFEINANVKRVIEKHRKVDLKYKIWFE